MKFSNLTPALAVIAVMSAPLANADMSAFHPGPVISEFGGIANVDNEMPIPEGTEFKIRFDVAKPGDAGALNRNLVTAARFLNMHVEAGVPLENMDLAIVIHGGATNDVTVAEHYDEGHDGAENANAALVAALVDKGVRIYVCGQSAAFHDVTNDELLPGVSMALSALTAHAILDDEGYTLNPF